MCKRYLIIFIVLNLLISCGLAFGQQPNPDAKGASPNLTLESENGANTITPSLAVQLQFSYLEKDMGPGQHPDYSSVLQWRRIRPKVKGTMLHKDLAYQLHFNTAPGALELMDFYIDYTVTPLFHVRVGQNKIPFTQYRNGSFSDLQLVDWPITIKYFGAERQVGFTFHDGINKAGAFQYELGVYSGMNARKSNDVGFAQVFGEKPQNPSSLVEPAPLDEFHPALALHLAYNHDHIVTAYNTDFEKRGPRFSAGGSVVWDANPIYFRDYALRAAPELLFKCSGFSLGGVFYTGFYEQEGDMDRMALATTGATVSTSYLIGHAVEIAARYSYAGTTKDLRDDAAQRGDDRIASASAETLEQVATQYANAGLVHTEREYNAGINVFLSGRTLKLQNDASWLTHIDYKGRIKEDLLIRSQLQLAF